MPLVSSITSSQQAKQLRDNITQLVKLFATRGRRRTIGTLIGGVRTKQFPDNPIAGQQVSVIFVADVRLREFDGQPVARDVLVTNQAHALVASTDADGTPVAVDVSASGTLTIVGRAGLQTEEQSFAYYRLDSVDGVDLSHTYGLRLRAFAALPAGIKTALNIWRVAHGRVSFSDGDMYFADPQLDAHGESYYPGYIGRTDGGRFIAAAPAVVCGDRITSRDWYDADPVDWWYGTPADFATEDPWYAAVRRTVCEEV